MRVQLLSPPRGDTDETWTLDPDRAYTVIGLEAGCYRIVDAEGEPLLFPQGRFRVLDGSRPAFWSQGAGGDVHYPEAWLRPGFFEDYFDGDEAIVAAFWAEHDRLYEA